MVVAVYSQWIETGGPCPVRIKEGEDIMGKIKDFVTGIFSKKDKEEVVEVMQLEPAAEPNRDFAELESRYDTPDYQAFLHEMGYVDGDTDQRAAGVPDEESSACEPVEEVKCCDAPAGECDTEESCDAPAEEAESSTVETFIDDDEIAADTFIDDDEIAADTDMSEEDDQEAVGSPEDDFDQDFIEEGIAELGVNDVWPEEEN